MNARDTKAKAALRQRISDIISGACGRDMDFEDEFTSIEEAARYIPALRSVFGQPQPDWYPWQVHCIERLENIDKATDFLFESGVRANKRLEVEEP